MMLLHNFALESGLKINCDKTQLICIGLKKLAHTQLKLSTNFTGAQRISRY